MKAFLKILLGVLGVLVLVALGYGLIIGASFMSLLPSFGLGQKSAEVTGYIVSNGEPYQADVSIQYRKFDGADWATNAGATTTNSDGYFSLPVKPSGSGVYYLNVTSVGEQSSCAFEKFSVSKDETVELNLDCKTD